MKKFLFLSIAIFSVLFSAPSPAQNLPLFEAIKPAVNCPVDKITTFANAIEPMRKAGQVIYVLGDASVKGVAADWFSRYTASSFYYAGGTQQPRYNGLYGTPPSVGSLWADKVGWIDNLATGTVLKANAMISEAANSGWNIKALYSVIGSQMSVVVNVQSNKPVPLSTLKVKCFLIDKTTHRFIQYIGGQGAALGSIPLGNWNIYTMTGAVSTTNYEVVVTVQDSAPFALDGVGPDAQHLKQGDFERIVLCSNFATLSK